jgi:YVTN family beta-propeller protein
VSVIDTGTDQVTASIEVGQTPHGLAITPDGSRVLVAGFGTDQVSAIDTATNQVGWQVAVAKPHNIAIAPDGKTAYVASQAQDAPALAILDVAAGTQVGAVPLQKIPRALNVSPNGEDLVFTQAGVDAVQVLDRASNQVETQIPMGASPHHPLFTPDGTLGLVVSQGPGELTVFDPERYTTGGTVKVGAMPHWIAASGDSRTAYVTDEASNDVSVVDLATRTVTATIPVGNAPRKIVVQGAAVTAASTPLFAAAAAADPADSPTQDPAGATAGPAMPATAEAMAVSISGFAFAPETITVSPGQPITWTNMDAVAHTTTSDHGAWDSGSLAPGASFTAALTDPGTYTYHCAIHPFMTGTVVVQG